VRGTTVWLSFRVVPALPSVRMLVVVFGGSATTLERLVAGTAAAAHHSVTSGRARSVALSLGDGSPSPVLDAEAAVRLDELGEEGGLTGVSYEFFDANLGSAGGINRLAASVDESCLLVLQPDTYPAPTSLSTMLAALDDPSVGAVDARQVPLVHPKDFDPRTGDTSWLSGACLLVRHEVFVSVGGFDSEHFFLHGDDVDFSWRVRLGGWRIVHEPRAVVFHDKRLGENGHFFPDAAERYYGALGRLMLAHKFDRHDVVMEAIAAIEADGTDDQRAALDEWRRREAAGALPVPPAGARTVAQFVGGDFATHRF
jgi:hypothetical protein